MKNPKRRPNRISKNIANLCTKSDNIQQKILEVKSEIADLQATMCNLLDKQEFWEAEHAGLVSEDTALKVQF